MRNFRSRFGGTERKGYKMPLQMHIKQLQTASQLRDNSARVALASAKTKGGGLIYFRSKDD